MINNQTNNVVVFRFDVNDEDTFGGSHRTEIRETITNWYSSLEFELDPFILSVQQQNDPLNCKIMVAVTAKMTEIEEFAYKLKYPTAHLVAQ